MERGWVQALALVAQEGGWVEGAGVVMGWEC